MTLTQVTKAGLHDIALDHVFTIGASGSDHYTFQGEGLNGTVNDPTLYLTRGKTYRFENGSGGHPIRIQSTSGASGTAYNTGVTNNAGSGTVIVEVQHDAPDVLYYQCTSHANMNGVLYITGALADGGVTTAKLADDAVTDAKLANSINSAIAANTAKVSLEADSVTGAKIADDAVGAEHIEQLDADLSFADSAKAKFGAGNDLEIYHDGSHSRITNSTGVLSLQCDQINFNNGANNESLANFIANGKCNLNFDNSTKLETANEGIIITGDGSNSNISTASGDLQLINTDDDINLYSADDIGLFVQTNEAAIKCIGNGSVELYYDNSKKAFTGSTGFNISGNCDLVNDNNKLQFGNDADLQIYHDGSNSVIDNNTGNLYLQSAGSFFLQGANNENVIKYNANGAVELYYDNELKLVTQADGVTVQDVSATSAYLRITSSAGTEGSLYGTANTLGFLDGQNHYMLKGVKDGGVELFYDNVKKLTTTANGICFNSDTAAANALDDYEEGTWTPALDGTSYGGNSHGYIQRKGNYVKVGKLVTVSMYLSWNNFNGSGGLQILGLPFTCWNNNSNQHAGAVMTDNITWPSGADMISTHNWYNTSYFRLYSSQSGSGWSMVSCDSAGAIICTLTYLADT